MAVKRRRSKRAKKVHPKARAAAAHRHDDAGPDRIVCLLCGQTFRSINVFHLRRIHGFEGEHPVWEYKARFGLEVAMCEETRQRAVEIQVERHKREGSHWTDARLVRELRRRCKTPHGLAYSRVPDALSLAARRRYGSWDAALQAAGVQPLEHKLSRVWSRDRVLSEIQRHARQVRRLSASWAKAHAPDLLAAAYKRIGNWGLALEKAGLQEPMHREPKRWELDRVRSWVLDAHARGRDLRSIAAPPGAIQRVAREGLGPWTRYVESLGIPYPGQRKRMDWTDAAVLAEIRKRKRAGLGLSRTDVVDDVGQALTHQARNRFGSWDAALEAAGIDPLEVRRSRAWTAHDVLTAIRERERKKQSLRRVDVRAEDPRLVKAAVKHFPSSWNRAVEAALGGRSHAGARPARPRRHR